MTILGSESTSWERKAAAGREVSSTTRGYVFEGVRLEVTMVMRRRRPSSVHRTDKTRASRFRLWKCVKRSLHSLSNCSSLSVHTIHTSRGGGSEDKKYTHHLKGLSLSFQ